MTGSALRQRHDEAGFTLVELIVVTLILGVIGYALTESVILGLKTTDATAASSSRSVAAQALASSFTDDAQSAVTVDSVTLPCVAGPVDLVLHLTIADEGVTRDVSYALEPAGGSEQELVRWHCIGGSDPAPDRKILGHFTRDRFVGPAQPVSAKCDGVDCLPAATPADEITLTVSATPPLTLTVRPRSSAP